MLSDVERRALADVKATWELATLAEAMAAWRPPPPKPKQEGGRRA
jgi:hypothetical protein